MTGRRALHVLSQRPGLTGSGVTLDALVRHAAIAGWDQVAVVGVPAEEPPPQVADLAADRILPLHFGTPELPFPVPGMSDVMPYRSTRFSAMTSGQLDAYRDAWRRHLDRVIAEQRPDIIHTHHIWLVTSLLRELAPTTPVVAHCHATGLRQAALCPQLAAEVRAGCCRADRFCVLHHEHTGQLASALGVAEERIHVVGAGFREDLFHARGHDPKPGARLLYVGKYSTAKGLPWLLDAVERLKARHQGLELHIAGGGAGNDAELLLRRMQGMAPTVVLHGQLEQPRLAELMRRCSVCVLPSLYEGLPLVLVEALACGCRLVATALTGIVTSLAPHLGEALELIAPPALRSVDRPVEADLPRFVDDLEAALDRVLALPRLGDPRATMPGAVAPFTWTAVFGRVESLWKELLVAS